MMRRWQWFAIGSVAAAVAALLALARYSPAERNARAARSALTLMADGESFRTEAVDNASPRQQPPRLAYNTVLTVLRRLEEKGYVGHEEGRAHRYFALVDREQVRRSACAGSGRGVSFRSAPR